MQTLRCLCHNAHLTDLGGGAAAGAATRLLHTAWSAGPQACRWRAPATAARPQPDHWHCCHLHNSQINTVQTGETEALGFVLVFAAEGLFS